MPQAQDPMVLIGELVKALNLVRGVGCASAVGLPPAALSSSSLDKRVGTSSTST